MGQLVDATRAFLARAGRRGTASDPPARAPASDLGRWLRTLPAERRLPACLDFLLYWLAYGDAPPDPAEKGWLLAASPASLGTRDAAKRFACTADPHAFADAVHATLDATDPDQRSQLMELVLAVRFCEGGGRGAAENVTLRFLADVLGTSPAELARRHERACGEPLPALPRLEANDWWLAADEPPAPEWEGLEPLADDERSGRRRLGLAASGAVDGATVAAGLERRLALVAPVRFDRLGRHERAVAERLHARLVAAHDDLRERAA